MAQQTNSGEAAEGQLEDIEQFIGELRSADTGENVSVETTLFGQRALLTGRRLPKGKHHVAVQIKKFPPLYAAEVDSGTSIRDALANGLGTAASRFLRYVADESGDFPVELGE